MLGQEAGIKKLLAVIFSGGHVLLEDFPGTGKTTLAKTLARSLDAGFKRLQCTPDLLPTDIIGVSIYDQKENEFHIHQGPIFTNFLLADELNRASPRTQSALLQAMAEKQVSIDGQIFNLPEFFCVIATQNPVEMQGTYPLPESQLDRFTMQFDLGYVTPEEEVRIISAQSDHHPLEQIQPCVSIEEILQLRQIINQVRISAELKFYIVNLVNSTRQVPGVRLGASPRASLALMHVAKALAFFKKQEFVTPEDIQELAVPVIAHRLLLDEEAMFTGHSAQKVVSDLLFKIAVPV
jgi:MoxR-like ATPase